MALFLNASFINSDIFAGASSNPSYNKLSLFGNGIFGNVWVKRVGYTDEEIDDFDFYSSPMYDDDTIALSTFETRNTNYGNLDSPVNVESWDVFRQEKGESQSRLLDTLDVQTIEYNDFTIQPNVEYKYEIVGKTDDIRLEPLVVDDVSECFYGFYLLDEVSGESYKFDANVNFSGFKLEKDITVTKTSNKYPSVTYGNTNYRTATLTSLLGTVSSGDRREYEQTIELMDRFREFAMSKGSKILKTRKGEVLRVDITGVDFPMWIDELSNQFYNVVLNMTESEDVFV